MSAQDKSGRAYVYLLELCVGDSVQVDGGFSCMDAWAVKEVEADEQGRLYVRCADGSHTLDGELQDDGSLIGVYPA